MKKDPRNGKPSQGKETKKRFSRLARIGIVLVAIVAAIGLGTVVFSQSSKQGRNKTPQTAPAPQNNKKYVATQEITVDPQTGAIRKPNADELKQLVDYLKVATNRSTADIPVVTRADGSRQMTLEGRLAPIAIAKPRADGTMEVRCVTTMEEATAFLGLEESTSDQAQ
jgi:uncharacterized protein HemX